MKMKSGLAVAIVGLSITLGGCSDKEPGAASDTSHQEVDLLQQALNLHVAGDLVGARKIYIEIVKNDQNNKYAYYNLGLIDQTNGDLESAANEYSLALTIDSAYYPALYNLGIIRETSGNNSEAIGLYEKAIAASPDYARAHLKLGRLLKETGEVARGEAEIATAIELDPAIETAVPE